MWRSESMSYMRMIIPIEAAQSFVDEIGRSGVMQFIDLNTAQQAFQRRYIRSITMINDIQRLKAGISGFLDTYDIPHNPDTNYIESPPITPALLEQTCTAVREVHNRLVNDFTVATEVKNQLAREQELEFVLDRSRTLIGQDAAEAQASLLQTYDDNRQRLLGDVESGRGASGHVAFRFIAGIVTTVQRPAFERQVFLTSRGNAYTIFMDVETPEKEAFVVFFLGAVLEKRLTKLCHVMNVNIYLHPDNEANIPDRLADCRQNQIALRETLFRTESRLKHDLFGVSSQVGTWDRILLQSKSIYSTMNLLRINEAAQMVQAEGWVPLADQDIVRNALRSALASKGFSSTNNPSVVQEVKKDFQKELPPTFIRTNKFTNMYQTIVSTYGVPRYGEINPGVLTIMTFPFLFGVMYGDVFHGTVLFLFSLWLIMNEKKLQAGGPMNEFFGAAFSGRYVLVFMGFFATFCGFIYNDFTSIPLRLFASRYDAEMQTFDGVYPFGIDWVWYGSKFELAFLNSLKMKMAIVLGVTQMTVGVVFGLFNYIHERDYLAVVCEFIPRFLFITSFFGYMCFIILRKWCMDWNSIGTHRAPSLIGTLIAMVLKGGSLPTDQPGDPNPAVSLFAGQSSVQAALLLIAVVCVPWMLLTKPLALWVENARKSQEAASAYRPLPSEPSDESVIEANPTHEEFNFAEMFVGQMIHTIEYVLSCVSNTASYLRLWALSLAHAQLASVFYTKLVSGFYYNPIILYISFFAFLTATFGVLLGMDVLECFLHALRLHWVEFMSKFYYADGVAFKPFSYLNLNKDD